MQPYKNLHCKFIHDDRARPGTVGDVVWLRPERAERINREVFEREGIKLAVEPLIKTDSDTSPAGVPSHPSPFDRGRVFSLDAKARRAIARSLGAPKNVRTKIADGIISRSPVDDLKAAAALYLEG